MRHKTSKRMTKHHIYPLSRGGGDNLNIARISRRDHERYHALFNNMTPDEIIAYLVKNFWNYQWFWVTESLRFKSPHD